VCAPPAAPWPNACAKRPQSALASVITARKKRRFTAATPKCLAGRDCARRPAPRGVEPQDPPFRGAENPRRNGPSLIESLYTTSTRLCRCGRHSAASKDQQCSCTQLHAPRGVEPLNLPFNGARSMGEAHRDCPHFCTWPARNSRQSYRISAHSTIPSSTWLGTRVNQRWSSAGVARSA